MPTAMGKQASKLRIIPEFSNWVGNYPQPSYTFATWRPPQGWTKHLYKNLSKYDRFSGRSNQDPYQVLYITLQGVVFLYSLDEQWPGPMYSDIPVGATIVAEYVPLLPAVKDGVVPVYLEPVYDSGYVLPPVWQRALHMKDVEQYVVGLSK